MMPILAAFALVLGFGGRDDDQDVERYRVASFWESGTKGARMVESIDFAAPRVTRRAGTRDFLTGRSEDRKDQNFSWPLP
jgi:hypothetical protein